MTAPVLASFSRRQFAGLTVVSFMVGLIVGSLAGWAIFGI